MLTVKFGQGGPPAKRSKKSDKAEEDEPESEPEPESEEEAESSEPEVYLPLNFTYHVNIVVILYVDQLLCLPCSLLGASDILYSGNNLRG